LALGSFTTISFPFQNFLQNFISLFDRVTITNIQFQLVIATISPPLTQKRLSPLNRNMTWFIESVAVVGKSISAKLGANSSQELMSIWLTGKHLSLKMETPKVATHSKTTQILTTFQTSLVVVF